MGPFEVGPWRTRLRLFFVVPVLAACTNADSSVPADQGASSAHEEAAIAIFAEYDRPGSPGCAVGVVQEGGMVLEAGYGEANLDWGLPIEPSTVFYVGSVSKQFTAAAVALLSLEGKVDLDASIRSYVSELPVAYQEVTVRHLIHHTGGVIDIYRAMDQDGLSPANRFDKQDGLRLLASKPLDFPPGDRYSYSNGGYFLLAWIVERASGQTLREFTAARIFEPLGMADTHFHDDPEHIVERRAMSYEPADGGGFRQSYWTNFALPGQGGLYSTVEDLAKWDANWVDPVVGGPELIDLMHTTGVLNDGTGLDYAFAIRDTEWQGHRLVQHSGSMMGFKAHYHRFPDDRTSIFTFCNLGTIDPGELGLQLAGQVLGSR